MARKRRGATVTIRMNRDGTYNFRSTGGYDLRTLFPELREPGAAEAKPSDAILSLLDDSTSTTGTGGGE